MTPSQLTTEGNFPVGFREVSQHALGHIASQYVRPPRSKNIQQPQQENENFGPIARRR